MKRFKYVLAWKATASKPSFRPDVDSLPASDVQLGLGTHIVKGSKFQDRCSAVLLLQRRAYGSLKCDALVEALALPKADNLNRSRNMWALVFHELVCCLAQGM